MRDEIKKTILALLKDCRGSATSADHAMKYAQAVLNLANAGAVLAQTNRTGGEPSHP